MHQAKKMTSNNRRLVGLDGIRGLAAICVAVHHTEGFVGFDAAPAAYLAVDLFFCLSGFVIGHAYERKLIQESSLSANDFAIKRLIRLYPLYLLGLLLGVLAYAGMSLSRNQQIDPMLFATSLIASMFFLPAIGGTSLKAPNLFPFNGPSWSLFLEIVINLAYGYAARMLSSGVLALILLASWVWLAAQTLAHGSADLIPLDGALLSGFPRVLFSFSLGILMYRYRQRLSPSGIGKAAAVTTIVVATALLVFQARAAWVGIKDLIVITALFPIAVLVLYTANFDGVLRQPLLIAGEASYALYAIHVPLLGLLLGAWKAAGLGQPPAWAIFAIVLPLIVLLAIVVTRLYDEPVRKALSAGKAMRLRWRRS
ncbi:acyltransferase family protein [Rhizobium leguminosarum]|uniref:acyltransferase family protein n=1 Tax=Rhizobium leguminosarum TaxID=384 RepID=UPI001C92A920|nr:acyltransferase [Rhizobium leguminosarum]MBY2908875.1 acyltransferase [Rhizobium leguminosarum]